MDSNFHLARRGARVTKSLPDSLQRRVSCEFDFYTDYFAFPSVSFLIWLPPLEPPSIQKARMKCLPGVRSGGRVARRTRRPPGPAPWWPTSGTAESRYQTM